jgi:hypothetical protein
METAPAPENGMRMLGAFLVAGIAAAAGPADAATIINRDSQSYLLKITESGQQSEVGIAAGESIEVCGSGCFLTLPNGDRETLAGPETVEITGGKASIK